MEQNKLVCAVCKKTECLCEMHVVNFICSSCVQKCLSANINMTAFLKSLKGKTKRKRKISVKSTVKNPVKKTRKTKKTRKNK